MKNLVSFFVGISLLVLIACYGCGVPSSEAEMKQAQEAMEKAKSVFAEDLAASNWNEAMTVWEQGQAAVKEGKPAKTLFLRAKSRFEKTAAIAKAEGEKLAEEVNGMQLAIGERLAKVQAGLQGRASSKVKNQLKPIVEEAALSSAMLESLASQGNYMKAYKMAKELQSKLYNAELILAGKKPVS